MAQFIANGSKGHHKFILTVTEENVDVDNNKSSVYWKFELTSLTSSGSYSWSNFGNGIQYAVSINGAQQASGYIPDYTWKTTKLLASGTVNNIAHNADGSKTINVVFTVTESSGITAFYTCGNASYSGSFALTNIARFVTFNFMTPSGFMDTENPYIGYTNPIGNFNGTLKAGIFNGNTALAAYRDISKTDILYKFELTDTERNAIRNSTPNAKDKTLQFKLQTAYTGGTTHTEVKDVYVSIVDADPIVSVSGTPRDANEHTRNLVDGTHTYIIRYESSAEVTGISATPQKGASISSLVMRSGASSVSVGGGTARINNVEDSALKVIANDSRGFETTQTINIGNKWIPYVRPTLSTVKVRRVDITSGKVAATYSGVVYTGLSAWHSSIAVKYRYRELPNGDWSTEWSTLNVTLGSNKYSNGTSEVELPDTFDYLKSFELEFQMEDKVYNGLDGYAKKTKKVTVMSSVPVFDWGENDFQFNVPVFADVGCMYLSKACGELGSNGISSDFNEVYMPGVYKIPLNTTHGPYANQQGVLLVYDSTGSGNQYIGNTGSTETHYWSIIQEFRPHIQGQSVTVCRRTFIHDLNATEIDRWNPWYAFTTTAV